MCGKNVVHWMPMLQHGKHQIEGLCFSSHMLIPAPVLQGTA